MTIISVQIAKLVHSPRNGRQPEDYPPDSPYHQTRDIEEQILHFGLLQAPTAHPMPRGRYGVFIGGRRLLSLQRLIARGALPKDHAIDIAVRDEPAVVMTDMSFAENVSRVALSAVTEFKTYAQLMDEGADIAAIARRYNVTELHVRQRMRLGQLHPDILAALEAERISLDMIKAYAATTDQELQKRVFDQQPGHPYEVRAAIKRDAVNAGVDRMIALVTLEAYNAAGGRAEEDLFVAGETRLLDVALLKSLYDEKLAAATEALRLPANVTLQFSTDGVGARSRSSTIRPTRSAIAPRTSIAAASRSTSNWSASPTGTATARSASGSRSRGRTATRSPTSRPRRPSCSTSSRRSPAPTAGPRGR